VVNGYIMEVALTIMPVGLYTRKGKNGRKMYFRDGKLISKKSYTASRGRSLKRRPSTNRKRSTGNPRRKNMARYKRPAMPHPSVTGMAAGLSVAQYLNAGQDVGITGIVSTTPSVLKDVLDSNISAAFGKLSSNAVSLVKSDDGKKVLSSAIVVATAGGLMRKWFPTTKLGGNKMYFRI